MNKPIHNQINGLNAVTDVASFSFDSKHRHDDGYRISHLNRKWHTVQKQIIYSLHQYLHMLLV